MNANTAGDGNHTTLSTRLAHWVLPLLAFATAARILYITAGDTTWVQTMHAIAMVALLASYTVAVTHQYSTSLCVQCMTEVPTDASQQADRRHLLLRVQHLKLKFLITTIAVLFGVSFLGDVIWPESKLPGIPVFVWLIVTIYSFRFHHRVRPWCPYCRDWDGDGDPEVVPNPDPSNSRKVPR